MLIPIDKKREFILDLLTTNKEVIIEFTKVDGTVRRMPCTLNPAVLPVKQLKESRKKEVNLNVIPVFCTDKQEWRSFRVDSVIKIEVKE